MKHWLLVLSAGMLAACSVSNSEESKDRHLLSEEVFKTKLGKNEVYGVRLMLTTPKPREGVSYRVQLSQNELVWIDTLMMDLKKGDTVETELIFSEAVAAPNDQVEIQTQRIDGK